MMRPIRIGEAIDLYLGDLARRGRKSRTLDAYRRKLNALADLDSYGVAFVSLRGNLDLSTPSGRLMFQIIGAMSEFERSLIQRESGSDFATSSSKGRL